MLLAGFSGLQFIHASVQSDIDAANKAGKAVFLVVTEPGNAAESQALSLANGAQKIYTKSTVLKMNRADQANAALVSKYQLANAPLPIIVVIASNGTMAGGTLLANSTSAKIAAMVPSPKKAEVLKAMQQGKAVFLVVSKKDQLSKKEVVSSCQTACTDMKNTAKVVEIDFDDAAEKKFLTDLKITTIGSQPQTYVINSGGQVTGSFSGVTDTKTLSATATKKAGGCCPTGSGKSCPPPKSTN